MTSTEPLTIFTIGHSTRPVDEFIAILKNFDIGLLVDIRTIPKSRYNPQFTRENLQASLKAAGIQYEYMKDLGGLRHARKDSPNLGWHNSSFRGYADYMQTENFRHALEKLIRLAEKQYTAIMCAEAVPWRCHRSLVGDALLTWHIQVQDIMGLDKSSPHQMTKFARVEGHQISYPDDGVQTRLL